MCKAVSSALQKKEKSRRKEELRKGRGDSQSEKPRDRAEAGQDTGVE